MPKKSGSTIEGMVADSYRGYIYPNEKIDRLRIENIYYRRYLTISAEEARSAGYNPNNADASYLVSAVLLQGGEVDKETPLSQLVYRQKECFLILGPLIEGDQAYIRVFTKLCRGDIYSYYLNRARIEAKDLKNNPIIIASGENLDLERLANDLNELFSAPLQELHVLRTDVASSRYPEPTEIVSRFIRGDFGAGVNNLLDLSDKILERTGMELDLESLRAGINRLINDNSFLKSLSVDQVDLFAQLVADCMLMLGVSEEAQSFKEVLDFDTDKINTLHSNAIRIAIYSFQHYIGQLGNFLIYSQESKSYNFSPVEARKLEGYLNRVKNLIERWSFLLRKEFIKKWLIRGRYDFTQLKEYEDITRLIQGIKTNGNVSSSVPGETLYVKSVPEFMQASDKLDQLISNINEMSGRMSISSLRGLFVPGMRVEVLDQGYVGPSVESYRARIKQAGGRARRLRASDTSDEA